MDFNEYEKVKNLNYKEYCTYLQDKYGIPNLPYFNTKSIKNKISRTSDGLFIHHIKEDVAIMLSDKNWAKMFPYEYQLSNELVYCDYLEHLLLHILICENLNPNRDPLCAPGIGGVQNFLVPQLNDFYSGFPTKRKWEQYCFDKVKNDYDVYKLLVKRFKHNCSDYKIGKFIYEEDKLYSSFNATRKKPDGTNLWDINNDKKVIDELKLL